MGLIVFFVVSSPFFIAFLFLIAFNVGGTPLMNWSIAFLPIWFLFLCWFFYICYILWKNWVRNKQLSPDTPVNDPSWKSNFFFHLFSFMVLLPFTILIAQYLQYYTTGNPMRGILLSAFVCFWVFMLGLAVYSLGCSRGASRCCRCLYPCSSIEYVLGSAMWLSVLAFSILVFIKVRNIYSTMPNIYRSLSIRRSCPGPLYLYRCGSSWDFGCSEYAAAYTRKRGEKASLHTGE